MILVEVHGGGAWWRSVVVEVHGSEWSMVVEVRGGGGPLWQRSMVAEVQSMVMEVHGGGGPWWWRSMVGRSMVEVQYEIEKMQPVQSKWRFSQCHVNAV